MIKKACLGVATVGLVTLFLFGKDAYSYLSTSYRRVTESVEDSVPIEFQIDRARDLVRDLEPEIRRCMHVIAKEEVEVQQIDEQIGSLNKQAAKEKDEMLRLQSDLSSGKSVFRYSGRRYVVNEVKQDLARRFARYQTGDATLASLRDMRDARQRNLDAAREKLQSMMASQRQLNVEVENLEAKLKMVEVAATSSDLKFDDSRLARAKQLISDIRVKLDVAAKVANADVEFVDGIQLEEAQTDDIAERVAEYFHLDLASDHEVFVTRFQESAN